MLILHYTFNNDIILIVFARRFKRKVGCVGFDVEKHRQVFFWLPFSRNSLKETILINGELSFEKMHLEQVAIQNGCRAEN